MPQNETQDDPETRKPSLQSAIKNAMAQDPDEPRATPGSKRQALLIAAGAVALALAAGTLGGVYQASQLREVEAAALERQRAAQELERTVQARDSELTRREAAAEARERTQAEERRKATEDFERAVQTRQAELAQRQSEVEAREGAMTALVRGQQLDLARREATVEIREQTVSATERRTTEQAAQLEKQAAELREREKKIAEDVEEAFHDKRILTTNSLSICNQTDFAVQIARASVDWLSIVQTRIIEQWLPIEKGKCLTARVGPGRAYVYAVGNPDTTREWKDWTHAHLQCLSRGGMRRDWRADNVTCAADEIRAAFIEINLTGEETTFNLR
jgi:hypothetical protein